MKLSRQFHTRVLDQRRHIQFIDEIYHVDEKNQRQGKCEKHDWFEVENYLEGAKIERQTPKVWSIDDPNPGRPAFVYVSERGTYKDNKENGLWARFWRDGSILSLTSYEAGKPKGICMEKCSGKDCFYRIGKYGKEYDVTEEEIDAIRKQAQKMIRDTSYASTWVTETDTKVNLLEVSRNIPRR